MIDLLFEFPVWFTGFNFLVGLFVVFVGAIGTIMALSLRKKIDVSALQISRADAAEALVKTREAQKAELELKLKNTEEELEDVTAEHRTLSGITITELLEHWANKDRLEAHVGDLERELRILKLRKDGDIK